MLPALPAPSVLAAYEGHRSRAAARDAREAARFEQFEHVEEIADMPMRRGARAVVVERWRRMSKAGDE